MYVFQPHIFLFFVYQFMMVRLEHVSISILMLACLHHSSVLHAPGSAHHTNCIVFQFQVEYVLAVASHMPFLG